MKKSLLFAFLAISLNVIAQNTPAHSFQQDPTKNNMQHRESQSDVAKKLNSLFQNKSLLMDLQHPSREVFDLVQRFDSIYQWTWDSTFYNWALAFKFVDIQYNAVNLPTSLTGKIWNGTSWDNNLQIITSFDGNYNETISLYKSWNGSSFENVFQTISTYDGSNNKTGEINQFWLGSWMNTTLAAYTYDGNHNVLNEVDSQWDGVSWQPVERYNYTYNGSNHVTSEVHQTFDANNLVWINLNQILYTYDGSQNLTTVTDQNWNGLSYDNVDLFTYTYDGNHNQLTSLTQYWDNTAWVNVSETTNTYNGNNLLLTSLSKNWNGSNFDNAGSISNQYNGLLLTKSLFEIWNGTTWKYSSLSLYTYGENNFIQSESNRNYDGDQNLVTDGDSTYYYFKSVAGTHDLITDDGTLSANPNPSTGKFTLTSQGSIGEVEIFNFLGERVYSARNINGASTSEINMTGYARGAYLVLVKDGTKISSRKIVIQ